MRTFLESLADNWSLLFIAISVIVIAYQCISHFWGMPTEEQIRCIKEWLLYAVIAAERELGSGTGKLKLRQVYDAFITKFPWAARVVSFTLFSIWVDEVLVEMKRLLESSERISDYVDGRGTLWEDQ